MKKVVTEADKEKQASQRLLRTYGIDLQEYESILENQGDCCAICKRPPSDFSRRLHVDHDHKVAKQRITVIKQKAFSFPPSKHCYRWIASSLGVHSIISNVSGKDARDTMRMFLMRHSVRGILCWTCNKSLQVLSDNPVRFENAAKYLRAYKDSKSYLKEFYGRSRT